MSVPKHHPTYATKIYNNRIIIELIQRCFSKKNGEQMYQYLVICRDKIYFVKGYSKSNNKYKQDEIIQMLDFLIDNICVVRIVLRYSPICFYILMRQISFKNFSRIKIEN